MPCIWLSMAGTPRFRLSMDSLLSSTGMSSSSASSALGLEAAARQALAVNWREVRSVRRSLDLGLKAAAGTAHASTHFTDEEWGKQLSSVLSLRAAAAQPIRCSRKDWPLPPSAWSQLHCSCIAGTCSRPTFRQIVSCRQTAKCREAEACTPGQAAGSGTHRH